MQALGTRGKVFHPKGGYWAALTLGVCQNAGGRWEEAIPVAAATELFIAAGDLLDDIEDRDLVAEVDLPHVLNVASALLFFTSKAASRLRDKKKANLAIRAISKAGVRSCLGQYHDFVYETLPRVSEDMWLHMTELRSGSLVECACRLGAIVATDDERTIETYSRFGCYLGIAGQIVNDLHSLEPGTTKSDIARKKKTLPLVYALNYAKNEDRRILYEFCNSKDPVTREREQEIRQILVGSGSTYYCAFLAEEYRLRAFQVLREAGISPQALSHLETVTQFRG